MGHLPALDGLRGVAIAFVVGVHLYAPVFSGGNSGVDLFFVLSGFLITKLALDEADRTGGLSLSQFYLRRVFRIFPALFVMLAFLLLASVTFMSDVGNPLRREIMLSGASMGNLWPVFYGFEPRGALGHTWSLGIEEQFYLVWPFILFVSSLAFRNTRRFAAWVAGVTIVSGLLTRVVVVGILDYPHWKSIPFFDFDGLALGCILAMVLHMDDAGRWLRVPNWLFALAAAVVVSDLFIARAYIDHDHYGLRSPVLRVAYAVILAAFLLRPTSQMAAPFRTSPMRMLGRLSYSLYLWHVPIFTIFSKERHPDTSRVLLVVTKVVVSAAAAVTSYYVVERPAIEYGRRLRERRRAAKMLQRSPAVASESTP
jgi:peptidoglycan/LPS O-acetylase OafA/YrhL